MTIAGKDKDVWERELTPSPLALFLHPEKAPSALLTSLEKPWVVMGYM